MNFKSTILSICLVLSGTLLLHAQESEFPNLDASPMDAAHYPRTSAFNNYMEGDQKLAPKVKVLYCRPQKKEREIFGKLVPYGKLWRLGANEATEVTFYTPVEIGGKFVNNGTYTMFAEVHPNHWVITISSERFVAGTANLDATKHIASAKVPVTHLADSREAFTIGFQKVNEGKANMIFEWDRTRAVLPINFNPASLSGTDNSPMDMVQYPSDSRFRNFLKEEELEANTAKVRVVYSRPQKKGRTIFGELLKYGEPWRLGANETTEITFFQDVNVGGTDIKKGTYGIMATVNKDSWEFVIHSDIPTWGTANHNAEKDIATVKATVESMDKEVEALSIAFDKKSDTEVHVVFAWDKTKVRLPVTWK